MSPASGRLAENSATCRARSVGQRLLDTYTELAARGEHLLHGLLAGQPPCQWQHYPDNDAIDGNSGYQWYYHSHAPGDRRSNGEHGHFHLFARRPLWSKRLQSKAERDFVALTGYPQHHASTRHLLGIGMDAKGVPISLFTVNSWVTGDLMLSAEGTEKLLGHMRLRTGHDAIDAVLECVVALCTDDIHALLSVRDMALSARRKRNRAVLSDQRLEVLSAQVIMLDEKLRAAP